ncbi:MAG: hypothetical protein IT378_24110 [Sandaracinaceae bacterium]|nr:hypothetical protein [Sandaracinaceae bacterium]
MSTPQYGARVLAKEGPVLTLQILSVSEDSPIDPDARDLDFFVRLLCDEEPLLENPRKGKKRRPALPDRIGDDGGDLYDEEWLWQNATRYVASVDEIERRNEDATPRFASWDSKKRAWKHQDELAQATFRVRLTDPAFAGHLEVGDGWDSCAYGAGIWAGGGGGDTQDEFTGPEITIESVATADAAAYSEVRGLAKRMKALRKSSRAPNGGDVERAAASLGARATVRDAVSNERTVDVALADGSALAVVFIVLDPEEPGQTYEDAWAAGNVDSMVSIFGPLDASLELARAIASVSGPLLVHAEVPVVVEAQSPIAELKSTLVL